MAGFFERFKRVRPAPKPATSRITDLVDLLMKERRVADLEAELSRFDPASLSPRETRDRDFYLGVAAERRGDRAAAYERFRAADARHPDDPDILFGLGQEHEFRGEPDVMVACLRRTLFPRTTPRHAMAGARYCYLWDRYEDALALIEPLFAAYLSLGVADDHFVYVRGLPFFSETWDTALVFWKELGRLEEARRRLAEFKRRLTDFHDEPVTLLLESLSSGDASALDERERRLAAERGGFRGYFELRLAIRAALRAEPAEGLRRMRDFALDGPAFPWLKDMRALALAACARRAGEDAAEEGYLREFFAAQPMLFEPHHALGFGLLDYQDSLKPRYRASRRA